MDKDGYALDENGFLRLRLEPADQAGYIKAHLFSRYSRDSKLVKNILPLMTFEQTSETDHSNFTPPSADFLLPLLPGADTFALKINRQKNDAPWAEFAVGTHGVSETASYRRLIVGETQIIGRSRQSDYPRKADYRGMLAPTVDQHTHLSAQLTGGDLIEIGLAHAVRYPVSILDKLKISYPKQPKHGFELIKKLHFLPYARLDNASKNPLNPNDNTDKEPGILLRDLPEASRLALQNAMSFSPEAQSTVEDMERCYFHREPFTKNLELLPDILRKVAADYKKRGIRYAELSTNAMLDPAWLKVAHAVMKEKEMDPHNPDNVMMRFRPGFPRNLDEDALMTRIEKYKLIADSPYVAGPDFLGFEMNKTSDLRKHLDEIAGWMAHHTPEDSIQIHAGENGKNPKNVLEAIEVADRHNIRVLVGHAIYGINKAVLDFARDIAQKGKLIMVQLNFASNLAGNNIEYPHDVDVRPLFDAHIPCLNNSDGAGFYSTDPKQCAMMAMQCGLSKEHFEAIRNTESAYIDEQRNVFIRKEDALTKKYGSDEGFFKHAQLFQPAPLASSILPDASPSFPPVLDADIAGKHPAFFAGAGGASWQEMLEEQKKEFKIGIRLLLEYMDPDKVYLLKGRTKKTGGIGTVIAEAVQEYNESHAGKPYILATMLAEEESVNNHDPVGSGTIMLPTNKLGLPSAMASEVEANPSRGTLQGAAFFIRGKQITLNLIEEFNKREIPFGLMDDVPDHAAREVINSASSSKARTYHEHAFEGARGMVKYAMAMNPDMFRGSLPKDTVQLTGKLEKDYKRLYLEEMGISHAPASYLLS